MPVIRLRHLTKIFGADAERALEQLEAGASAEEVRTATGGVVAVRDVSLDIEAGEIFVIMGLSGSGKSTLLRCINRLIEPTRGRVLVDGEDITQVSDERLRTLRRTKMSMVFQHFGLLPHRTALGNVEYGLEVSHTDKAERRDKARRTLEVVGLGGYEESTPDQLSGGMQQRVGLARALVNNPEILLMDEPFSALDPLIRTEMQRELISLQEEWEPRCTIVFITHDLDEALTLGDRIAIMNEGAITQVGTPQDILLNPADEYVQAFVQNVDRTQVITASALMGAPSHVASTAEEARTIGAGADAPVYVVDDEEQYQGVLTPQAGSSADIDAEAAPVLRPNTPMAELMPIVLSADVPAVVLDAENRLLGVVGRDAVLTEITRNMNRASTAGA